MSSDREVGIDLIAKDMASRSVHEVGSELNGLRGMALGAGDALQQAGVKMRQTGRTATTGLTLPLLGAGAAIFKVGSDFDTTLRQILALTDTAAADIGRVRDTVLTLAGETGRAPQELAESFYFLASAGFDTNEALDVLRTTAMASAAGMGDAQSIAQVLGLTINAYGHENITAAHAADVLLQAIKDGTAEADAFAGVLGRVVPTAATMGVTFDQVTAALSGMTLTGLSAEEAGTSLNQVLVSLLNPTKEAEDALADMGTSSKKLRQELKEKGLLATLRDLEKRFKGNDEAAGLVFGNVRALRGVLSLLSLDGDQLTQVFADTAGASGDLARAFGITEGPGREFDRAMADIQATLIDLAEGVMPVVVQVLGGLRDVLGTVREWWGTLDDGTKQFIVTIGLVIAALGPILIVLGAVVGAIGTLVSAFAIVLSPIGLLVAGIGLIAVKTGVLGRVLSGFMPLLQTAGQFFGALVETISAMLSGDADLGDLIDVFTEFGNNFGEALGAIAQSVAAALPGLLAAIGSLLGQAANYIVQQAPVIAGALVDLGKRLVAWVAPMIPPLLAELARLARAIFGWVLQQAPVLLNRMLELGKSLIQWVSDAIPGVIEALRGWAQSVFNWLVTEAVPQAAAALGPMALAFVDWLIEVMPLVLDALNQFLGAIIDFLFQNVPVLISTLVTQWVPAFIGWIVTELIPRLLENLPLILQVILTFFAGAVVKIIPAASALGGAILSNVVRFAGQLPGMIASFLASMLGKVIAAIPGLAGKAAELGSTFLARIVGFVITLPGKIAGFLADMLGRVIGAIPGIAAKAVELGGKFLNGILDFAGKLPGKLGELFVNILIKVGEFVTSFGKSALDAGKNFVVNIAKGLIGLPGALVNAVLGAIRNILPLSFGPLTVTAHQLRFDLGPVHEVLASYKTGTSYVPETGPAYLHRGEAVLPADVAATFRQFFGGGAPAATIGASTGGGASITVVNYYGAGSVRSEDDIREISREQAERIRLLGFAPTLRAGAGVNG